MTDSIPAPSTPTELGTKRATIADLAPELIGRILELAVEDDLSSELTQRRAVLLWACRVCRSWRVEGQRLLPRKISVQGAGWSEGRLQGLLAALDQTAVREVLAIDLIGLQWAIQVLAKSSKWTEVRLMGSRSIEVAILSPTEEFARIAALKFARQGGPWPGFSQAKFVQVQAGWWDNLQTTKWVTSSIANSKSTLKHLSIHRGRAQHPALADTLARMNLSLDSLGLIHPTDPLATRVLDACSASSRVLKFFYYSSDPTPRMLDHVTADVHELEIIADGNLLRAGPFLQACLDAPASARLKWMTIEGSWAKTLALTKSWTAFAEKARKAGVGLTLIDFGSRVVQREVVYDTE